VASLPSGEQFELTHGAQHATIVEVGGGIRTYSVAGRDVLDPYPAQSICDGGHGAALIPWPNRLGEGRYTFDGVERQLDLSEPARGNAIHGLMRWRPWVALEREPAAVTMGARLLPQPGYPFALELQLSYRLDEGGLSVACSAQNIGAEPCPYGFGQHPYLSPGAGRLDDCTLMLAARSTLVLDEQSLLPIGHAALTGGELDFNTPRALGGARIDAGYTDLVRDADGRAGATLKSPDGATTELWVDEHHTVLQLFTGDTLAPARQRRGLALEPMTCPPNAFRTGDGLIRLQPGESLTTRWGVRLTP
jgi:aldose 1-epimerase